MANLLLAPVEGCILSPLFCFNIIILVLQELNQFLALQVILVSFGSLMSILVHFNHLKPFLAIVGIFCVAILAVLAIFDHLGHFGLQ